MASVIDMSRRRPEFMQPSECPFCDATWASAEPNAPFVEDAIVAVTPDQFRKHLGHHLQQIALFSLPRQNQGQELGSNDVAAVPDRDTAPLGWRWKRDDLGRGWSLVFSKKAKLTALATFLGLYISNKRSSTFLSSSLFDVDLQDVPNDKKIAVDGWTIIYKSSGFLATRLCLVHSLQQHGWVTDIRFSVDGKYIATACYGWIRVFDVTTGLQHRKLELRGDGLDPVGYYSLWFSPDGERIVSGDNEMRVTVSDVEPPPRLPPSKNILLG